MRKIFSLCAYSLFSFTCFAQIEGGINYSLSVPLGDMGHHIQPAHNAVLDLRYRFSRNKSLAWMGVQLGLGNYAHKTREQEYMFSDGSTTRVNVTFTSNIFNAHLAGGYDLLRDKAVTPYVTAKAGFSTFYSRVYIPDPTDNGSCTALKNKNVYDEAVWSAGMGAGLKLDANKIFKATTRTWWIDFSLNYLTGGNISYLNVKHIVHDSGMNPDSKGFNVQFVNVSTNEIHEHQVAEVFKNRISLLDFKVGVVVPF